jgi:hypothetical protein
MLTDLVANGVVVEKNVVPDGESEDEDVKELYLNKYRVMLKLLNKILKHIQKDKFIEITKIEDFQKIDGRDLRNAEVDEIRKKMDREIVAFYEKKTIKYDQKTNRGFYTYCVIKYMAKDIGYELKRVGRKGGSKQKDDKIVQTTILFYSIVKQ